MPSIYDLKPCFQALLRPFVGRLANVGVTANQVTIAAVVLSAMGGSLIACYPNEKWPLALMPAILFVRMGLNAVDGMLAREFGQKSRLGAVLNELCDVVSDAMLYLPLALVPQIGSWSIVIFVVAAVVVEFAGVVAIQIGSERRYDGPMGKSDRAFWVGLLATLLALGLLNERWATIYACGLAILSIPTVINRSRRALTSGGEYERPDHETRVPKEFETMSTKVRCEPVMTVSPESTESKTAMDAQTFTRRSIESSFLASDGQKIFYRLWRPAADSDRGVMLFHRGHEHSARWQDFVDTSEMSDCWFFAWDARGHGRTAGERGAAESFSRMVRDADEFAQHICDTHGLSLANFGVVGQSVGAVLAAAWIHDYAPPVRAMVLATPALRIKLYVPLAIPGLRVLSKIRPKSFIKSYVKPGMLTHDKEQAESYANDPLVSPQIAVNILLDLHDASTRLIDDAGAIHTPTLMFVSGKDYVVRQDVQQQFFDGLSSKDKRLEVLDEFYHSTFWEKDRAGVIRQSAKFLRERFDLAPATLTSEELGSGSREQYESLQSPPSALERAWFAIQRTSLNTIGRLSRGVRIGWASGFDSGQSLDHVYRDRAEGTTLIGRMIDRGYLDSIGWCGIRKRKIHMERLLDEAITHAIDRFGEITILDIAAGPGRYVLETIKRNESLPIRAILCDRDPGGIAEGRDIARQLGLEDRVQFRQSDAFDPEAIQAAVGDSVVHIAIVSGLYELFPENTPVKRSLSAVGNVLVDGGWLLYTDQPWHPQQKMIARVLPNRDGDPWVMRCRSQAEMDALVREAGLQRHRMYLDQWGIFSVALARKS